MIKIRLVGRKSAKGKAGRSSGQEPGMPRPLMGGRVLGELEESFIEIKVGDTFAFALDCAASLRGLQDTDAFVTRTSDPDPAIPSYAAGLPCPPILPNGSGA